MANKNNKGKMLLLGVAAAAVYSAVAGKGPFNKYRFREQHEELSKYIDTNYPYCSYSNIEAHGKGYTAAIMKLGKVIKFVYFTKDEEGNYIFTELNERMN